MTAMTTQAHGLPYGRPLTYADLETMPDDGHRYELVDGVLIVSPAPVTKHQRAVARLTVALLPECPEGAEVLPAPFDVVLDDHTVIQPDLVVARKADLTDRNLPGPPLLAIEILSPSTRAIDLAVKKDRLARAGCPQYWVVDPDEPSITAWALHDGEYIETAHATGAEQFSVTEPFPVTLTPDSLVA
ncbi:hypothetical protein C6V83_06215 [Gordonia iterans]|uniref:Putative restriction endonuclease domain-containing protein n=1 Tax=Gordonia iterans TaxID=1004901 RepID=A0A2S0KE23_9ACTN|nr:Uma2 family endonuclease [Gordonia iterans]AVL99928.1 hypothetical protein C6V83_06215 [Gordonia iterans]